MTHIVVTVPRGAVWTLPAYELALLFAAHARKRGLDRVRVALVTPEDEPLLLFGGAASDAIPRRCSRSTTSRSTPATRRRSSRTASCTCSRTGRSRRTASSRCRRSAALGSTACPQTRDGFVVVDAQRRVDGHADVYAAGDITTFPVKQGGIATQQADAAAEAIAAAAGARSTPRRSGPPPRPAPDGRRATLSSPRRRRRWARAASTSVEPLWWPPAEARRPAAGPVPRSAAGRGRASRPPPRPGASPVDVELGDAELAAHRRSASRSTSTADETRRRSTT